MYYHVSEGRKQEPGIEVQSCEDEPQVRLLNMPKAALSNNSTFSRTRQALISKSAFNKLNIDTTKNSLYESQMDYHVMSAKERALSIYDVDFSSSQRE